MRRLLSLLALAASVGAQVLVVAAPASAYEVHLSLTGAGQVTETTSANLLGSGCVTSAANPTGTVGVNCYPGDPNGDYAWGWTVRYVATPKPGYDFVRWESDGSPKPVICDGANGSSTYTGTACQFTTYDNLQMRAVFADTTAPVMASLSGPNGPVNGATAFTFAAQADPTLSQFECRVVGVHDWLACASGRTENPASSGSYTFEVRAVDTSGNRSAISTWGWTVDKTAPETSLSSGPSGTVASTSATFEFNSNEQGTFQCSIDDGAFSVCGSPKTYPDLSQGAHTFAVRAVDVAGNPDPAPASRTWTVDTVAPDTSITAQPGALTNVASASFDYASTEAGSTFACTLDGSSDTCGPYTVADGEHTFTVAATDGVGNTDTTPATYTWVVDTVSPTVLARTPTGRKASRDATPTVKFSEAMRESTVEAARRGKPLALYLTLDGAKVAATVTYTETATGTFRAVLDPAKRLKAGKRYRVVLTSRAQDLAGNGLTGTSWTFRTKG